MAQKMCLSSAGAQGFDLADTHTVAVLYFRVSVIVTLSYVSTSLFIRFFLRLLFTDSQKSKDLKEPTQDPCHAK